MRGLVLHKEISLHAAPHAEQNPPMERRNNSTFGLLVESYFYYSLYFKRFSCSSSVTETIMRETETKLDLFEPVN